MKPSEQPLRHLEGQPRPDEDALKLEPRDVKRVDAATLEWTWGDGHVSTYRFKYLRVSCPCAACVDEWSGKRRVEVSQIAEDVVIRKFEPVGAYAVRFEWSDGHNTGLYSFRFLREICPCSECQARRAAEGAKGSEA
ncbi:MAG: DUF971 domain-containing protein [Planctomycetes bacterium]|nr:DUF971 domain-containing protein [Planctomycetota bacterium]